MNQADLVIIGISVGLAIGILIAIFTYLGIRWYRQHAHLHCCSNERSVTTLPIRTNGLDVSTDLSASLGSSTPTTTKEIFKKNSAFSWWTTTTTNHTRDWLTSASGILQYPYKYVKDTSDS